MKALTQKVLPAMSLLVVTLFYVHKILSQVSVVDTADGVLHYQYARFATQDFSLIFDHWAKPLFTLLAVFPAQWGLRGVAFLNLALIIGACYFVSLSVKELKGRFWVFSIFLVGFGNSITYVILSGLTEPLFMFVFSVVIFLFVRRKDFWASFFLGSTLLVRPEAIVVIPVFLTFMVLRGVRLKILGVLVVPLAFSILGWALLNYDFLWIITKQPYDVQDSSIYGHGHWMHFPKVWFRIAPHILWLLFVLGLTYFLRKRKEEWKIWVPIVLSGMGIILLHVVLWKFGWAGSAGLPRTLLTAFPALAVVAAFSFDLLWGIPKLFRGVVYGVWISVFVFEIYVFDKFPLPISVAEDTLQSLHGQTSQREEVQNANTIVYQFALAAYYFDINPFDLEGSLRLWHLKTEHPSESLDSGDVIIWDNITGSKEGKMSWERIKSDPHLIQLDSASVEKTIMVSFLVK